MPAAPAEDPAEQITPEMLAAAPFALVVGPDGRGLLQVVPYVDDAELGAYLHNVAEHIRTGAHRGGCAECEAGRAHQHPGPPPEEEP